MMNPSVAERPILITMTFADFFADESRLAG
jgi:hypothetical protein